MTTYIHHSATGRRLYHGSKVTFRNMDCTIATIDIERGCILSDEETGILYVIPTSERDGSGPLRLLGVG